MSLKPDCPVSSKEVLPSSVVCGELQDSLVEHRVSVDVDVLGDGQLDGRADPNTLRQSQESLHSAGSVIT